MIAIIVNSALVFFLVGSLWASRRIRLIEYASNRSRSESSHIFYTILGSLVGGWMFFGLCAIGYEAGVAGIAIGVGYCIGLIILAKAVPKIKEVMENENCDTLDDFVGTRYGKKAQVCVTAINLIFFLAVLAAQFVALTAFLKVFAEIDSGLTFYVAVFVVITYTSLAGFKGVLYTDKWQFYILTISALVIFTLLTVNTKWSSISSLSPRYFNGTGYGIGFLIGTIIFFPPSLLVRTDMWQRIASSKDAKKAQRAIYLSAPIILIFYILLTFVGIYGRVALGGGVQPDTSGFIHFLDIIHASYSQDSLLLMILLSVFVVGVLSAILSTADTNLNVVSISISKLIKRNDWGRFEKETPNKIEGGRSSLEQKLITVTRIITFVLGIMALGLAKIIPDIVDLIVTAASSIMVFLPMVLVALYKNKSHTLASIASMVSGFVVLIITLFLNPKIVFLPATVTSAVVFFVLFKYKNTKRKLWSC